MKRLLIVAAIVFFASTALCADVAHKQDGEAQYITQILYLSADGSASLGNNLCGGYLFSAEVFTSADDAVTFSIASRYGTVMLTGTTTAATSGEYIDPTAYRPMNCNSDSLSSNDNPQYTLSGLGSGTAIIEVTVVKR